MKITDYFNKQEISEHVKLNCITLILNTNICQLDLDDIYNNTTCNDNNILLIQHNENFKHSENPSKVMKHKISNINRRLKKTINGMKSKPQYFNNCIIFQFKNWNIKLFQNGRIQMSGRNISNEVDNNINTVFNLVNKYESDPMIFEIKIGMIGVMVETKKLNCADVKSKLSNSTDVISVPYSPFYKFKNKVSFRICTHCILVMGCKSFEYIQEFVDFIGRYVVFYNESENKFDSPDDNEVISNEDKYQLQISI